MRKSFFSAACALIVGALLGSFGTSAEAAPTPTNLQLLDQLIAHSTDGRTVMQGDMVLSVPQLRAFRATIAPGNRTTSSAFYRTTYWTGGRVFYTIDPGLPQVQADAFVQACREWERWANLKFTPRTSEANYINVVPGGNSSNSAIGMAGGAQTMNLATWASKWTACHELAHALGVMHEQSRSDRDKYVEIKFDNVDPTLAYNYAIINDSDNHREYDFDSIMHYGPWGFAIDPNKPTLVCKPPYEQYQSVIGQSSHLTELDKAGMADIYGFPPGVTATPVPTPTLPPRPTLVCEPVTVREGDSGTTPMTFRVMLSYVPTKDVSFAYKIVRYVPNGMSDSDPNLDKYSAVPGEDYTVQSVDGSITLPAATTDNSGNSTKEAQISLLINGDTKVENDESITLVLSDPINARFANDKASINIKGTISNDDFATPEPTATKTPEPTATPKPTTEPTAKPTTTPRPTTTPAPPSRPTARVSLSPISPSRTSTLVANVALWPSKEATATLVWKVKGITVAQNVYSLDLTRFSGLKRGDEITVEVTPHRGQLVGEVATARVEIANTPPVARPATLTTLSAVPVSVVLGGSDIDGDALTFALSSKPLNGVVTLSQSDGKWTLTYRSKVGFIGTESIGVVAIDGRAKSEPATIQIKVNANTSPELVSVSPSSGTFQTATTLNFVQTVKDTEKNVTSVAFLVGNSTTSADARNGVGLAYDAPTRTVRLTSDSGATLSEGATLGETLENNRAKVILRSVSVEASGVMTLRWQITFKPGWTGEKTLWARAEDAGTLIDGFRTQGKIKLTDSATASTKAISAGNS
ncbi:flavastacin [Abditibacteriota bacterium]|nr:flavastacin [Abditibacteriota bacterium]